MRSRTVTIAPANPPLVELTITDREVAMNSALPRPQPARNATMLPDEPASAAKTTMSAKPAISVRLTPILLDTQPVTSIATAVTTR